MHRVSQVFGALALIMALGGMGAPTIAQSGEAPSGICAGGTVCGPSPSVSFPIFPTLTPIRWDAFPTYDLARHYAPAQGGRAWYVAVDGDDHADGTAEAPLASLGRAVERATNGDVIWVRPGQYTLGGAGLYEGLILATDGLTLAATEIGQVTLTPAHADTKLGIAARADNLTVDGFVVRGFADVGVEFGRAESSQRGLVLAHLRIEQTAEGVRAVYGGDGLQPLTDGMLIYDLWLREIGLIGLQCGQGPCDSLRWEAIRVEMPSTANETANDAIALESGENIVLFNVEVAGAPGDGIDLKTGTGVVANALVHDVARNGIKIWHGGDVINALVYNTDADAALVFEAGRYRILNTLVARHAWGLSAYAMTAAYDTADQGGSMEIVNSVFYENSGAIWVAPTMELRVSHSLLTRSTNGIELEWSDLSVGETAQPLSALETRGAGEGNLPFGAEAAFFAPQAGDYRWGAESALLDAGTDAVPLPPFDLFGQPRVQGAAVDLGPIEGPTAR